jgi:hypothetical protein
MALVWTWMIACSRLAFFRHIVGMLASQKRADNYEFDEDADFEYDFLAEQDKVAVLPLLLCWSFV